MFEIVECNIVVTPSFFICHDEQNLQIKVMAASKYSGDLKRLEKNLKEGHDKLRKLEMKIEDVEAAIIRNQSDAEKSNLKRKRA